MAERLRVSRPCEHSTLPMVPFGRRVVRAGGGRIASATLRYTVRGWNGQRQSPLPDARWALDQTVERFGQLPIGLVGHPMGGRVALRVAEYGGVHGGAVRSVAALAPWLPDGQPTPLLGERALLLAHGTADRITDAGKTAELAQRLTADGCDVQLVTYPGARHAMLFPVRPWHDLVASFMVRTLLEPAPEGPPVLRGNEARPDTGRRICRPR